MLFPGTGIPGIVSTRKTFYTDNDGVAEFEDAPVRTVKVYVNGEEQLAVGVGDGGPGRRKVEFPASRI